MTSPSDASRKYKGFVPTMGIWMIKNQQNGRVRIGWALHVKAKLNKHRFELDMGSCRIASLQQDWKTYGPSAFTFELLDELKPNPERSDSFDYTQELQDLEQLWLEKLQPFEPDGYHPAP